MEEKRKSVLETTKPSGALERLTARSSQSRAVMIVVGVVAFFGIIFLLVTIFNNTIQGSERINIPSVSE